MDSLLNQLAQDVTGANDLESLVRPMLALLEVVMGLESTYLTSIDEGEGIQHIVYARNSKQLTIPEGLSVPWGDTLCKRALDEGKPYTDDVAGCWGDSDAARALGIQTYVSQPVHTIDGTLYGTLCAASGRKVPVEADELRVLGLFARLIAQQIERERLLAMLRKSNAELSSRAMTDPLTGLANRRAVINELTRLLAHTERRGDQLLVAFIDLDDFKQINDRYGHDIGDHFLIHIAERLRACVRTGDLVGRLGGDEFVVLTSGNEPNRLQDRLERATTGAFHHQDIQLDYAGASVGVVDSRTGDQPDTLLSRADQQMYALKQHRHEQASAG